MGHYSAEQTKEDLGIEESPPPSGSVDFSNYYTKTEINALITGEIQVDDTVGANELGDKNEWGLGETQVNN